ncbi:MAG: Ldh family oxidoreductase, partial [Dehalococcoidia bacterium]
MITLPADTLTAYLARIFDACGAPAEEARLVAEHLVGANLRGHDSHGVIRAPWYVGFVRQGVLRPGARPLVVKESASTAYLDGQWNFGQVVAREAMSIAIAKARDTGVGVVSAFNSGHIGRVGAYGEQAVEAGMIGIGSVNSPGSGLVAPFGGARRRRA